MDNFSKSNTILTTWTFRDGETYLVGLESKDSPKSLGIRITNKITAEEWICNYDAKYIQELSQRTGNFKSFDIFNAMLKSALLKSTDAVELDLVTYDDLKVLKNRLKAGGKMETACARATETDFNGNAAPTTSGITTKKYLIVKYIAEFDSVHYPLALTHARGPDSSVMESNIKKLQTEVTFLKNVNEELMAKVNFEHEHHGFNKHGNYEEADLQEAIDALERKSAMENVQHLKEMEVLQKENTRLRDQIAELQLSEEELNRQITRLERISASTLTATRGTRQSRNRERVWSSLESRHSSTSSDIRRRFVSVTQATVPVRNQSATRTRAGRNQTPSPARYKKFDPTAYVLEKRGRENEIAQMRYRTVQFNSRRGYSPARSDGVMSLHHGKPDGSPRLPRSGAFAAPSNTELRLIARRERSLSLDRLPVDCGRSVERRRRYGGATSPKDVAVQTKILKPKSKLTTARAAVTATTVKGVPRTRKIGQAADIEGSLEALQSYIEDTSHKITAYKSFGKVYASPKK